MKSKYLIKLISAILAISMIFGIMLPISAAWDGYDVKTSSTGGGEIKLIDANRIGDVLTAKGLVSDNTVGDDRYSIRWKNINSPMSMTFYSVPRDLSNLNSIRFSVYTEAPSTATVSIRIYTNDSTEKYGKKPSTTPYFYVTATTDHVGWKEFEFFKSDFISYWATGWDNVRSIALASGSRTGVVDDVNWLISSVYADFSETEPDLKLEATPEGKTAVLKALGDNTAIMNYSNNVIRNGKTKYVNVEDRISTDNSGTIAKFGLFSNVLGATVNDEGGRVIITLDGRTADVTDNVVTYDDGKYLKVNPTLEALGKTVRTYDRVTIIGDEERSTKIFEDATLFEDLKYMLNERLLSAKDITQADWDKVKTKWIEHIVGTREDLKSQQKQEEIKNLEAECERIINSINKDPNINAFFGAKDLKTSDQAISCYYDVKDLAMAYATYGCKYYKDPALSRVALNALDWLYENAYGIDELLGGGVNTKTSMDWNLLVGIPQQLTQILLLLGDSVSMELTEKYLYPYENCKNNVSAIGGRLDAGTLSSILLQDYDEIIGLNKDLVSYMHPRNYGAEEVIRKGYTNASIKEDWAYLCHKFYAYSSYYGVVELLTRLTAVETILMGTTFEFVNPFKYDPIMWMKETFGPIIFNGAITSAQSGRSRGTDQFSEEKFVRYIVASALDLIGCFGKDDDEFLKQLIKRIVVEENRKYIESSLNTLQRKMFDEIMNDESIVAEPYYNSKVYYSVDSAVHQKGDFGFAIAMSSSRIGGWESIDGQNITGWYQGDGMLYTYLKDDVKQYDRQYWKYVNPYHLPGTTVDTQKRIPASIKGSTRTRTQQHFVGGVQFDSDYSVVAMQLEGHKSESATQSISTTKSGDAPNHYSSLLAKKAWFLFDDEAVALGSDINANDGFEVQTVVENRKLNMIGKIAEEENPDITEYKIVGVEATASAELYPPENTYDDDIVSYWSSPDDQAITWELEKALPISYVAIAQRDGVEGRQAIFELEISADGKEWTEVFAGKASGQSRELEAYAIGGKQAKYIKYIGHGRTNSKYNVITEVKIFGKVKDEETLKKTLTEISTKDPSEGKLMGAENIIVDGELLEKASNYTKEFVNPKWAHIENVGGYYFPMGGELKMDKVTNDAVNFLEMWFNHGLNPEAGTYAYVVLPTKTVEETEKYTKNPDIEVLSNTKALQAVREKTLGMTGIVFWEAGKLDTIEATVPMIIMTKDKDENGIYRINLSDPTKLLKEGKVKLKGNYELVEGDKRLTVTSQNNETTISIDFKDSEGRSLPISLIAQ